MLAKINVWRFALLCLLRTLPNATLEEITFLKKCFVLLNPVIRSISEWYTSKCNQPVCVGTVGTYGTCARNTTTKKSTTGRLFLCVLYLSLFILLLKLRLSTEVSNYSHGYKTNIERAF